MPKPLSILLQRVSLGWLMVVWGVDKLSNVEHGQQVAEAFYLGVGAGTAFLRGAGLLQILLGLFLVAGLGRRWCWPAVALVTGITLLAVWRSIVDPWGLFIEGGNPVFYSSAVIFASVLVGWSLVAEDRYAMDHRRAAAMPAGQ